MKYHVIKENGKNNPLLETNSVKKVKIFLKKIKKKKKYKSGIFYAVECLEDKGFLDIAKDFAYVIKKNGKDITKKSDEPMLTSHLSPAIKIELKRLAIREDRLTNKQKYGISNQEYRSGKYLIRKEIEVEDIPLQAKLCKEDFFVTKYDIALLEKAQKDLSETVKSPQIHPDTKLFEEIEKAISIREKTLKKKREKLSELREELSSLYRKLKN